MADKEAKSSGPARAKDPAHVPQLDRPVTEVHGTIASGTGDTSIAPDLPPGARESQSLPVPTEFGRYKILRSLGQGAMGVVYLAEDTQLKRQVALKIPQLDVSTSGTRLERFYREARLAATLRHANLCPIFDVGEFQGTHFISMAYIEGKSLDVLLKSGKPQSERAAASLVRKVALALQEAHSHGVIHRDLKPANIMIDQRGEPIVMDFGLARQMNSVDQAQITHSGAIIGTPSYMSPEQVQGKTDEVGVASDIYGLGVILYQLLTGRLPFQGSMVSILAQIATQTPAPPSSFRDRLSPEIEAICLQAMAKRASDRFASMAEFAAALTQYLRKNPGRTDESRTSSAENKAASAGSPGTMNLAGVANDESSSAQPASFIAAPVGHRVVAKWRGLARRARIAAACLGVAFVVLAVVIIINNRDGTETKITVDDGDGDDVSITMTRERPSTKRDKSQKGLRGSEKLESGPPDSARSDRESTNEKAKTFDLLALMDGAVTLADGGRMFAMSQPRDGTVIPFQLPEGVEEYDVKLVARRLGTGQGLSLNVPLPAVGRFVNFYLDGFYGSGLQSIDGQDYKHPEINQKAVLFRTGFKSTIVCKIRRDRIEAIVDGRPLINWAGDQNRLAGRAQRFVLGCHNAHFEITELTVSLLPDVADKSPPPEAAATIAGDEDQSDGDKREPSAIDSDQARQAETDDSGSNALTKDKAVDLLSLIDVKRHVLLGRWTKRKKSFLSASDEYSLLQIPFRPPPEYTLQITAERTSRSRSDIQFGIVAGKNRCHIVVDGWMGEISGISYIDGRGAANNATTYRGRVFPDKGTVLIEIAVRHEHITVDADGKRIVDWTGSFEELSIDHESKLDRQALFLAIQRGASYRIDSMKLIPHLGEGKRIR